MPCFSAWRIAHRVFFLTADHSACGGWAVTIEVRAVGTNRLAAPSATPPRNCR